MGSRNRASDRDQLAGRASRPTASESGTRWWISRRSASCGTQVAPPPTPQWQKPLPSEQPGRVSKSTTRPSVSGGRRHAPNGGPRPLSRRWRNRREVVDAGLGRRGPAASNRRRSRPAPDARVPAPRTRSRCRTAGLVAARLGRRPTLRAALTQTRQSRRTAGRPDGRGVLGRRARGDPVGAGDAGPPGPGGTRDDRSSFADTRQEEGSPAPSGRPASGPRAGSLPASAGRDHLRNRAGHRETRRRPLRRRRHILERSARRGRAGPGGLGGPGASRLSDARCRPASRRHPFGSRPQSVLAARHADATPTSGHPTSSAFNSTHCVSGSCTGGRASSSYLSSKARCRRESRLSSRPWPWARPWS